MEEVPDDEEKAAQWLQDLFKRKDQMQESFHKHGDFFTSSGVAPIKSYVTKRRLYPMLNTFGWAIVILTPMLYYLARLLFSGELVYFSIGAGILIACKYTMQNIFFRKLNAAISFRSQSIITFSV
jgi:lysophosphatidic acid acyltransferase / lysophosphatidylinositol acyltransferase